MNNASGHDPRPLDARLGRRHLLGCAALFGVAGPLLVACGSDEPESPSSGSGSGRPGDVLIAAADVPVGGGVILTDVAVAVTQPAEGEFKAFDAHCTHQGTIIGEPSDGVMTCPLHGSRFTIEGENVRGPNDGAAGSTADLAEISVELQGGNVVRA